MLSDALDLTGFEDLDALIELLPELALHAAVPAMDATMLFLHGQIPPYPPTPPKGAALRAMTAKQRGWFFWALARGKLKLPYTRTGTLGRLFTEQTTRTPDAVNGEIGTALGIAPWVVGPPFPGETINGRTMYQARVHAGRWWVFEDEMEKAGPEAYGVFDDTWRPGFLRLIDEVPHAN